MTNTLEAEEKEEQQGEQQQEEEIKEFVPPKCAKRIYHTRANLPIEELWEDDLPSINLIHTQRIFECRQDC